MKVQARQPLTGVQQRAIAEEIERHFARKLPSFKDVPSAFNVSEVLGAGKKGPSETRIKSITSDGNLNCLVHTDKVSVQGFLSVKGGKAVSMEIMTKIAAFRSLNSNSAKKVVSKTPNQARKLGARPSISQANKFRDHVAINTQIVREQDTIQRAQVTVDKLIGERMKLERDRLRLHDIGGRSTSKSKAAQLSNDREILSVEITRVSGNIAAQQDIIRRASLAKERLERLRRT